MARHDRFGWWLPAGMPVRTDEWSVLGGVGVFGTAVGLGLVGGSPGIAVGVVVALSWLVLPSTHVFTLGHVLALVALPAAASTTVIAGLEGGLLAILVGPATRLDEPVPLLVLTLAIAGPLAAIVWLWSPALGGITPTAAALLVVGAVTAALLHRYEVVSMEALYADE